MATGEEQPLDLYSKIVGFFTDRAVFRHTVERLKRLCQPPACVERTRTNERNL